MPSGVFNTGQEPSGATISFYYYDVQAGEIDLSYKLPGGTFISAAPILLTGTLQWQFASIAVPGSLFKQGSQIKLIVKGSAIVAYLNLTSTDAMLQPPFGGTLNQAPTFTQAQFSLTSGSTLAAYNTLFSSLASDPDAGSALTFSKISGPSWLTVTASGQAQGTPASANAGANSFVVRATDPGGMYAESVMTIYVVSTTPPALGIARNGTNWQFSWPGSTHTGWVLETKTNLTDPTWTEFSTSRTSPGTFFVPISPTAHTGFFRLRYP